MESLHGLLGSGVLRYTNVVKSSGARLPGLESTLSALVPLQQFSASVPQRVK